METDAIRGHVDLLLPSVIGDGQAHGYGLLGDLWARSDDVTALPESTIYPALRRRLIDYRRRLAPTSDAGDDLTTPDQRVVAANPRGLGPRVRRRPHLARRVRGENLGMPLLNDSKQRDQLV